MFECSAFGMALLSPAGRFLKVNHSLCHMLGYPPTEMRALSVSDITHPDDAARTVELLEDLLESREDNGWLEKRYVRKDGRIVWALLSIWVRCDCEGNPLHMVAQIQDVTERKRAEEALRESKERYRIIADFNGCWQGTRGKRSIPGPSKEY